MRQAGPGCLDAMHEALERLWSGAPEVDDMQRMRFATALGELVANVVEHGTTGDGAPPTVRLELLVEDERVVAVLCDDGSPFEAPGGAGGDDPLPESGRGIALARAAADELEYAPETEGNRWRLVVRR